MTVLRTLNPSRKVLSPTRANAVNYAEPVAQAMSNLSGAYETRSQVLGQVEDAGITLKKAREAHAEAQKARKQKLDRAHHLVRFAQMRGEYQRGLMDLQQEYPASGEGYYQESAKLLEQHVSAFAEGIEDPELRSEFSNNVATFSQAALTDNYSAELTRQSSFYLDNFKTMQQDALNSIQKGDMSYEDWAPIFASYIENSPLPRRETMLLGEEAMTSLQSADFARQALEESTNYESIRGSHVPSDARANGTVAAAGLPAYAAGLLGAVGAVESSGLQYDLMYGGGRFSDFSKHPGQAIPITSGPHVGETSSAAGAFQFLEGTWNEAAEALGLTDFSPESQTRAAWWLAGRDYTAKTGRNIDVDLASGDPVKIERVRQALAGRGRSTTWEGLQNMSPTEFFAHVTGARPTPTGLLEDETYSAVPFNEKVKLVQLAEQQRQQQLTQQLEQQNAVTNAAIQEMQGRIQAGEVGQADLDNFAFQAALTAEQEKGLNTFYQTEQKERYQVEQFVANYQDQDYVFGSADKDALDTAYERVYKPIVDEADADAFRRELLPVVQRTGMVPAGMQAQLERGRLSNDINRARFSMMALRELQNTDILPASAISEEARADAIYYNRVAGVYKPEETVLEEIRLRNSQENRASREMATDLIRTAQKDNPEHFQAGSIAAAIDESWTLAQPNISGSQRMALEADFFRLYQTEFWRYGNHEDAREAAAEIMRAEWGVNDLGGEERFMRLPPQKVGYPAHLGTYDYIDQQVREDFDLGPDDSYELLADSQTRYEMQQGGARDNAGNAVSGASYLLKVDRDGFPILLHEDDGKPARVGFVSPTQRLQEEDGQVNVDNVQASVEAGAWVREFRELRSAVNDSEELAQMSALLPAERYEYFAKVLTPEQQETYLTFNEELNDLLGRAPKGYQEYVGSIQGSIKEVQDLLTLEVPR